MNVRKAGLDLGDDPGEVKVKVNDNAFFLFHNQEYWLNNINSFELHHTNEKMKRNYLSAQPIFQI